jgi:hypothetical protein
VTKRFKDRQSGVDHQRGDILILPPDRAQMLVATGCVKFIGTFTEEELPKRKRGRPPKDKAAEWSEDK